MKSNALHGNISKHDVLLWLREMRIASMRQLSRVMLCRTWGHQQHLHKVVGRLVRSGRIRTVCDDAGYEDIVSLRDLPDDDIERTLGATELKVAAALSFSVLGYAQWDLCGSVSPAVFSAGAGDDRMAFLLAYATEDDADGNLRHMLTGYCEAAAGLAESSQAAGGRVLLSSDGWPLQRSRRWLRALVDEIADRRLFVTNHTLLLDTDAAHALTTRIWYTYGQSGPVAVLGAQQPRRTPGRAWRQHLDETPALAEGSPC